MRLVLLSKVSPLAPYPRSVLSTQEQNSELGRNRQRSQRQACMVISIASPPSCNLRTMATESRRGIWILHARFVRLAPLAQYSHGIAPPGIALAEQDESGRVFWQYSRRFLASRA